MAAVALPASFGGKACLCGRRNPGFAIGPRGEGEKIESLMLESDDGIIWKKRAFFQETGGDETTFLFEADGSVLEVGRHGGGKNAQLLRSKPPDTEWDRKDLDLRPERLTDPEVTGAHVAKELPA